MSIDEIESVIVSASAIATAIFSFLIWRANIQSAKAAKGAADAATGSAKISKLMLDTEKEKKQNIRDQMKRDILKQINDIIKIITEMDENGINKKDMLKLPEKINVTNYELASYFSKEERQAIFYMVKNFETYRNDYFKEGQPNFKLDEKLIQDTKDLLKRTKDIIIELTDKIYLGS